jgi:transcription-repair coupling factor (superfamily II helicase)
VTFSGGRLAVTPIELDSTGRRPAAELPGAIYESGKSQVTLRVPDDPVARFPAVVAAARRVLKVASEPIV